MFTAPVSDPSAAPAKATSQQMCHRSGSGIQNRLLVILDSSFQKILVMPNMDDLIIPIMRSGLDPQPPTGRLPRDLPARGGKRL